MVRGRLRLAEAEQALQDLIDVPFGDLLPAKALAKVRVDKGLIGKLIERQLGLDQSTALLDFPDGELKSYMCHENGLPKATIAVTQISSFIDDIIALRPLDESPLWRKLRRTLYVAVRRHGGPIRWRITRVQFVDLEDQRYRHIVDQLSEDYTRISQAVRRRTAVARGNIGTTSGRILQIRTKDSVPYCPIFSQSRGRCVSTKNFAFYLLPEFLAMAQLGGDRRTPRRRSAPGAALTPAALPNASANRSEPGIFPAVDVGLLHRFREHSPTWYEDSALMQRYLQGEEPPTANPGESTRAERRQPARSGREFAETLQASMNVGARWQPLAKELGRLVDSGVFHKATVRHDSGGRTVLWGRRCDSVGPILHFWGTGAAWLYTSNPGKNVGSRLSSHDEWRSPSMIDLPALRAVLE